jgi:hypothetical protein
VVFYGALLLASSIAMMGYFGGGRTQLTDLSAPRLAVSARAN